MRKAFVRKLTIWFYCAWCWVTTDQTYEKTVGRTEYYRCNTCQHLNTVVVR